MPTINHAIDVDSCVVTETDVLRFGCQKFDNLIYSPLFSVHCVEKIIVPDYEVGTVTKDEGILYLTGFGQLLLRDHLVRFDVSKSSVVGDPDVNLPESIASRSSYTCFEICHVY